MSDNSSDSDSNNSYTESVSSDDIISETDRLDLTSCVIQNYNILYSIGSGSSSTVWLAYKLDNNMFYAIKVHNIEDYKIGKEEINFALKLPKEPNVFNNIIDYFDYIDNNNKYLCSVWNLHCFSVDTLLQKNSLDYNQIKAIMFQLTTAVGILHNKLNVFHGDLKTDNILIKGVNTKNNYVINRYIELDFPNKYIQEKRKFWESLGNKPDKINKMTQKDKLMLRKIIHKEIMDIIIIEISKPDFIYSSSTIDNKYLKSISISLSDFGSVCSVKDSYTSSFGTRYYMAPEIILMGKCKLPVDIWALGCILFELATGQFLFDPIKDHNFTRDYYHLKLIHETCGMFSKTFLSSTKFYKKFFYDNCKLQNYELFDMVIPGSRLKRKLTENNLDIKIINYIEPILLKTLSIEPNKRCNILELIKMI